VISAGGRIAGFLDTSPIGALSVARSQWRSLASGWRDALKGLRYIARMRRGVDRYVRGVERIEALGKERIESIRWRVGGRWDEASARGLLLHEGVIPHTHMTMSLGCAHHWDESQQCFRPTIDACGQTDQEAILVAGDCGGIAGARAAECRGRLAALAAARALGRIEQAEFDTRFAMTHAALRSREALRPFLDAMYRPSTHLQSPDDDVLVCRCEGISARMIRDAVEIGARGPNQAKAYTRCGMGPCQGRMCGLTVTTTIARAAGLSPETVGSFRIRPPLKPLSLGELASLARTGQAE
jgi:bacterioferritin-associated ferredoxin